jgi:acyl-CoA synthetase (NDP forming)
MSPLKDFMEPRSIAILGASKKPESLSALAIRNLLNFGYQGRLYLVNPSGGELLGMKVYSDLLEIDDSVDLAMFYLPPMVVVDAIEACIRKGVRSVIVVSDGLEEPFEEGKTITQKMLEAARRGGVRIMGPNSMGVINMQKRLSTSFVPMEQMNGGGLSIIAQTGLFVGAALAWIANIQNVGISMSIDLANKSDIDEVDSLEYLSEDPFTKVIGMHLEEVSDGRRFMEVAKRTSLVKPILAIKPGKTEVGASAIASHTGSLAGKDESYAAAFSQAGIIRVHDIEELADLAKGFIHLPPLKGGNIGVVTYTGGWGALAADLCDEFGLSMAQLSERSIQKVQAIAPAWRKMTNPIDIWPPTKVDTPETYRTAIRAVADDEATDAVLVLSPAVDSPVFDNLDVIREEVARYKDKPIVTWAVGNRGGMEKALSLMKENCLIFPTVRRALRVLAGLYQYQRYLSKHKS